MCYPLEVKMEVLDKKPDMNYLFMPMSKHWEKKMLL